MATRRKKKTSGEQPAEAPAPWRRATIDVVAAATDAISGLLLDEGALGLEIEDDETRAVPGRALMPTGRALVLATFSREKGLEARVMKRLVDLAAHVPEASDLQIEWTDLQPEDWNAVFMSQWKPFRLGRRVHVVPSWEQEAFVPPPEADGRAPVLLFLDPGMAFGTGTHETTQLCVEAVEALCDEAPPARLLDVGTGTGILAILALKLGAGRATGTDIDPVALTAARENAVKNGVDERFATRDSLPDADGAVYQAVVANILAGPLVELAPSITGALAKGGRLYLSGVLDEQERTVREAYLAQGLQHVGTTHRNGWVRIDLRRPA